MFIRVLRRILVVASLGAILHLGVIGASRSQEQLGSMDGMATEFAKSQKERNELMRGERQPQGKDDQRIIKLTAQWFVYRVTWKAKNDNPKEMESYHSQLWDFVKNVQGAGKDGKNKAFIDQLGEPFADALKEVFAMKFNDHRAGVLNAALMLPVIASLKQEPVGDLLVNLLNGKEYHDAIKVYAAKAMGEFFPAQMWRFEFEPKDTKRTDKLKRDKARLEALVKFINRKGADSLDEDERDVIRYLRREAIISLAKIGVPALKSLKKEGKVEGPAAYELLRILVKGDGALDPPPALSERVEAAIGLCHLAYPYGDIIDYIEYDPAPAIYAIGLCFLDFANEYSRDQVNLLNRKNKGAGAKEPILPWRIQAERFKLGMEDLVAKTKPLQKVNANAKALLAEITPMTDAITKTIPVQKLDQLTDRVVALKPASGKLYTLKDRQVTEEHNRIEINPASLRGGAVADGK